MSLASCSVAGPRNAISIVITALYQSPFNDIPDSSPEAALRIETLATRWDERLQVASKNVHDARAIPKQAVVELHRKPTQVHRDRFPPLDERPAATHAPLRVMAANIGRPILSWRPI